MAHRCRSRHIRPVQIPSSGSHHATTVTRAFQALRNADELVFFDEWEYEDSPLPKGPGYWAVTRYEDVWHASRNPQLFVSGTGVNIGDMPAGDRRVLRLDDHDGRPQATSACAPSSSKGFTPKQITRVEEYVRTKATAIVDRLLEQFPDGECDFVERGRRPAPACRSSAR